MEEFISQKYGLKAVPILAPVFLQTDEIITSIYYTLGLHMNNQSSLDFDYQSIYSRHCSGKWLKKSVLFIEHNVNRYFHLWKDVIESLSPSRYKTKYTPNGQKTMLNQEASWVIQNGWVSSTDKMNLEYLNYIITEKEYGARKALWALEEIRKCQAFIPKIEDYLEMV